MISDRRLFCLGLGRTGTRSFCRAAEILGYSPVLHNPPWFHQLRRAGAAAGEVVAANFAYLDARFPDADFVLTTRHVDDWLQSSAAAMRKWPLDRIDPQSIFCDAMIRNRMLRWGCLVYNPARMVRRWHEHHQQVLDHFGWPGAGRLLILDVTREANAWNPLCEFLELPVPNKPFPHENRRVAGDDTAYSTGGAGFGAGPQPSTLDPRPATA